MAAIAGNARALSNDVLAKWLIEDFPFRIQLAPVFPFYPIAGHTLRYATTPALVPGVTIDFGDRIAEDTKQPNDRNRAFSFVELTTQFRITYKAQDVFSSNVNDQTAVQMALAIRELLYKFWTLFEAGDASRNDEFDGLLKLVDASRIVDLQGRELTLEALDAAKELVQSNDGRCVVAFTSGVGKRAIDAAHWTRGLKPEYVEESFASPGGGAKRQRVLSFDGAQVYINDLNQCFELDQGCVGTLIPAYERRSDPGANAATNIWFFVMGENNLHGMTPAALGNSLYVTRSTILPDGSTLVYHVAMPVTIALGNRSALAVVKNATIPRLAQGAPDGR